MKTQIILHYLESLGVSLTYQQQGELSRLPPSWRSLFPAHGNPQFLLSYACISPTL